MKIRCTSSTYRTIDIDIYKFYFLYGIKKYGCHYFQMKRYLYFVWEFEDFIVSLFTFLDSVRVITVIYMDFTISLNCCFNNILN